jgi:AcrR family transcriptional regulator
MATDDTRQRLLEAAEQVFAEKGLEAGTVREIIRRAGVNLAAVNYHFGDKETLYQEAVKSAASCQNERYPMPDWPPGTPPARKLREFIHAIAHRMLDGGNQPWKRQLMMREMAQPTPACAALVREQIRPLAETLADILCELLPDVAPAKRNLIAFSIVGQCLYYKVAQPIVAQLVGPEEYRTYDANFLAEHVTQFSFAALGLKPEDTGQRTEDRKQKTARQVRASG